MVNQLQCAQTAKRIAAMSGRTATFEYWQEMEKALERHLLTFWYDKKIRSAEASRMIERAQATFASASFAMAQLAQNPVSSQSLDSSSVDSQGSLGGHHSRRYSLAASFRAPIHKHIHDKSGMQQPLRDPGSAREPTSDLSDSIWTTSSVSWQAQIKNWREETAIELEDLNHRGNPRRASQQSFVTNPFDDQSRDVGSGQFTVPSARVRTSENQSGKKVVGQSGSHDEFCTEEASGRQALTPSGAYPGNVITEASEMPQHSDQWTNGKRSGQPSQQRVVITGKLSPKTQHATRVRQEEGTPPADHLRNGLRAE